MSFQKIKVTIVILSLLISWQLQSFAQEGNREKTPVRPEEMPDYILNQLKQDPFIKAHFGWKFAFCQHPMYLLIDEDRGEPPVGERIPPWGAKNKEGYVQRVRRNLSSLEKIPGLRLNYQWSAVELESMAHSFPDIYEKMKKLLVEGSLDFLDGTYSQAHLQVLSSESNWRQFEYGHEVYKTLFDKHIDVYARQETGLHLQLPQLLKQFGYRFAALPAFHAAIEIIDGELELIVQESAIETIAGDEFINAVGLDGSEIPCYLNMNLGWEEEKEAREISKDLYSTSKIMTPFPDLDEVDQETYDDYDSFCEWVLLPQALRERYNINPPRARARVYSYWSYIEGVWAEELLRTMKVAEQNALLAEQMLCMSKLAGSPIDGREEMKDVWKTILKSQHHDISWIEVTDLKRKSINRLKETIVNCNKIMEKIARSMVDKDHHSIAVFNGLPRARKCLVRLDGQRALGNNGNFQNYEDHSYGFVEVPAGGFKSFEIQNTASSSRRGKLPEKIQTDYYAVELSDQGLFQQITTPDGKNILNTNDYLGGEIRARVDKKWVDNRTARCHYYSGAVCDVLERSTSLGHIPVLEKYVFFKSQPIIKAEIEFDFNGDEVGYFWIDKTKINIYYPTTGEKVYHDIPFGYTEAKQGRPLFPTNWLYCGGLVYVNLGTSKHWVDNGVIANVIAWGGNHFSNRLHWEWLENPQYDIRLYGKQRIEYFLFPLGDFDGNKITRYVSDIVSPVFLCEGKGSKSYYQIEDKDLAITSVYEKAGKIWVRGYQLPSHGKQRYRNFKIFNVPINNLSR